MSAQTDALQAQIAKAEERVVKLKAQLTEVTKFDNVGLNATVTFDYGRGNKVRQLTGVVTGDKPAEGNTPRLLAITVGSGFDAEVVKVPAAAVRDVQAAHTPDTY